MTYVLPPREVFDIDPESIPENNTERMAQKGYGFGGWVETRCPPEGGLYAYYEGLLYPYKGHPWADAVDANNKLKRFTLALLLPYAHKAMVIPGLGFLLLPRSWQISWLENWLDHYWRMFSSIMVEDKKCYTFQEKYYNNLSRELWKFIKIFLNSLGVDAGIADRTGKIFATLIEWDDAYRLRLEDLFSETSQEKMTDNPRREFRMMMRLLKERDTEAMSSRLTLFGNLLSVILLVPKIKKAFIKALGQIKFEALQLDKFDYYHVLYRHDYKFLGRDREDRIQERKNIELVSRLVISNN